jgi:eukaryotic-like serine/threonine-protein kinase
MTSEAPAPVNSLTVFDLLNAYLEDLHAGKQPNKANLLKEHPELVNMVACLEALDNLSPVEPTASPEALAPAESPTCPYVRSLSPSSPNTPEANGLEVTAIDFGKYELLGELGRGGMGVVFKARQKDLDRLVAIKMILSSRLASAELITRFHAESRSTARLRHPNIVKIYETGQINGQNYYAMEYLEGKSLNEILGRQGLSTEQGVRLLIPIVRAVGHLHA